MVFPRLSTLFSIVDLTRVGRQTGAGALQLEYGDRKLIKCVVCLMKDINRTAWNEKYFTKMFNDSCKHGLPFYALFIL